MFYNKCVFSGYLNFMLLSSGYCDLSKFQKPKKKYVCGTFFMKGKELGILPGTNFPDLKNLNILSEVYGL